jgi:selenide,water dikinase
MQTPERVRLTSLAACAGCASKVGAGALGDVLRHVRLPHDPNVIVGIATSDDAGVYRLSDDLALVQTIDFFPPIVDDPYDFGRIAATNAVSDIYAMGGRPISAVVVAAFPIDTLDNTILQRILQGGAAVATEAGFAILGGHTIKDAEPKYGMAVTGTIDPRRIVTNAGAQPGDQLLLTKPIGAGIMTTAHKRGGLDDAGLVPAIAEMTRLNVAARDAMLSRRVHAATDITGFGLIGHAVEVARASGVGIEINSAEVPIFDGVRELVDAGYIPGGSEDNLVFHTNFTSYADYVTITLRVILSDAMTSGGLLISAPPSEIRAMYTQLAPTHRCAIVGRVTEDGQGTISVL